MSGGRKRGIMSRRIYDMAIIIMIFGIILVCNIVFLVKYSFEYVVYGHRLSSRVAFVIIYVLYIFSFFYARLLFVIATAVLLYAEVYISCKCVADIYHQRHEK